MFIESITAEQLGLLVEYLLFASFLGAFVGANLGGFFELIVRLFGWASRSVFGPKKSHLEVVKELRMQRRIFLMRARIARRELHKKLTAKAI